MTFHPKRVAATIALLTVSSTALATNGYFTHGIGTHNKSMAGAGTARPSQAIDAANNPASGVLVDDALEIGIDFFRPERSYEASASLVNGNFGAFTLGEGTIDSGNENHLIPFLAKKWTLSDCSALTGMVYGRGGMNTDYVGGTATFDPDGPGPAPVMTLPGSFGAGTLGVNLAQGFFEVAYSWQRDSLSLGIAPMLAVQAFDINGVGTFAPYTRTFAASGGTQFPTDLTNNGHDISWGFGLKVGAIWQATDALSLALSYQSKIHMEEFRSYQDLFAQEGSFDIPATTRAGISYAFTDNFAFSFDVEFTEFGGVDSIANPLSSVFSCPTAGAGGMDLEACAGGQRGFGFGWDDVTVYKFGMEWSPASMPNMTVRAGYSTTDQPISSEDVLINIIAPAVVEEHFTAGVAWELESGNELSVSFMFAPEDSVSGTSAFDPTQTIKLSMKQYEFGIAYSFK